MYYADGQEVRVGDVVKLARRDEGVVVCSIDTGIYTNEFPEKDWSYLKRGVMIDFKEIGLVYYEEADGDISLVYRKV